MVKASRPTPDSSGPEVVVPCTERALANHVAVRVIPFLPKCSVSIRKRGAMEMSGQKIDVIIFGASGFSGKYVLRELLKFCDLGRGQSRRVGIAGRSRSKLSSSLIWAMSGLEGVRPAAVTIFEADVHDGASLDYMCSKTRLIINCVGPYKLYGEPVVAACIKAGIDYLDLAGEPDFAVRMLNKYHEQARSKCCLVVSSCAFESMIAELGLIHAARQVKPPAELVAVEKYVLLDGKRGYWELNFGTWESTVLSIADALSTRSSKLGPRTRQVKRTSHGFVHWHEISQTWAVKMQMGDAPSQYTQMSERTLATVKEDLSSLLSEEDEADPTKAEKKRKKWAGIKPIQQTEYMCFKSIWGLIGMFLVMTVVVVLSCFKQGIALLLKYPEVFSLGFAHREGPTEDAIDSATFKIWYEGGGYSSSPQKGKVGRELDSQVVTCVSGPDIGYVSTPVSTVQAALTILDRRTTLPKGGVLPPGAVFGCTDVQERLVANGMRFEVIKS